VEIDFGIIFEQVDIGFLSADTGTMLVDLTPQVHRRSKAMAKFRTLCGAGHFSQVNSRGLL